ncbi:hypothetical protein Tco_0731991 [Tanacetum coccineum]
MHRQTSAEIRTEVYEEQQTNTDSTAKKSEQRQVSSGFRQQIQIQTDNGFRQRIQREDSDRADIKFPGRYNQTQPARQFGVSFVAASFDQYPGFETVSVASSKQFLVLKIVTVLGLPGGNLQLVREALAEPSPSWSGIDEDNLDLSDLKAKHPLKLAPSLPRIPFDHHQLIASHAVVLDMIKSFPHGTSCARYGLCAQHLMDCLSGVVVSISDELVAFITQVVNPFLFGKYPKMLVEYIDSAPLTPLAKPGGGICLIDVGTVWRRLVSKVSAAMIGHFVDGYLNDI